MYLKTGVYVALFTSSKAFYLKALVRPINAILFDIEIISKIIDQMPPVFLQCFPQHKTFSHLLFVRIPAIECELHPQKVFLSLVSNAKSQTPRLVSYT